MADRESGKIGTFAWLDLTVPDAAAVRDFYASVIGWRPEPLDMGGYHDFVMTAPDGGEGVAGVCYARGGNADLPPQWLAYIVVADLDESLRRCTEGGGTVLTEIKESGDGGRYGVIRDPAGAVLALMQQVDA
ncbi:MAG: VOC family protein [Thermomicrobiales bacterium]